MKLEPRSLEGAVATSTVTAMEGSVKCDSLAARLRHIVGVAVHRLEQEIVTECIMEVVAVLDEEYGGFRTTEGLRTFCARLAASVAESKATICGPSSSRASLWSSHWGTHSGSRIPNLSSSTTPVRKRHSAAPRAKTTPTCEDGSLAAPSGPPNSVSRDRFTAATGPGAARPEDGEREHSASSADKHSGEPDSQRFRCGNLIVNTPATRATRDADSIYHDDALHPCAPLDAGCMLPASRDGTCSAALQSATTVNESRPCDSTTQYTRTLLASDAGSDSSVVSVFADSELSSSQATAAGPPAGIVSASIVSLEPLAAGGTSDPCAVLAIPQYPNFEDDEGPSVGFATLASKAKNSPHCSSSRLASTVSQNHNHAAYKRGAPQPAVPSVAEAALVLDSRDAQPGQPRRRVGSQPRREPSSADDANEVVGNQPGTGTTCPGTPIAEQTKSVKSHSSCKSQLDTNIDEKSEDGIFGSPSLEVRRKRLKLNHALPSAISTTSDTTWGPVRVKNNGGAESRHKELSSARPREVICSSMQVAAECRAARSGTSSSSAHLHGGLGQNPSDRPARGRLTREERLCADTVACSQCTNFYTALASHASHERIQIGTLATGPQAATSARAPVPLLAASRHRVLQLPDSTPPGFWNLDFFPEEDEAHGVGCGGRSTNG